MNKLSNTEAQLKKRVACEKAYNSFPGSQFRIPGFATLFPKDCHSFGGDIRAHTFMTSTKRGERAGGGGVQ